jgi:biopolymer transport protein ExbD
MSRFQISEYQKQAPNVQMAPLIDIVFLTLVFFMSLSIFTQLESELNISVPKASQSTDAVRSAGEIIINVTDQGEIFVNNKPLSYEQLQSMLMEVSSLFPDQSIIIRADELAYHKHIVHVLDACAAANIWNISFATLNEGDSNDAG